MGEYLLDRLAEIWPRIKDEMVNAKYNLLNTDWAWSVRCMVIGSYEKMQAPLRYKAEKPLSENR